MFFAKKQRNFSFFIIFCQKMKKRDFRSKSGIWGGNFQRWGPLFQRWGPLFQRWGSLFQRLHLGQIGPILQFCQKVTKTLKKTDNVVRFDRFYIFSLHFYDFRCRSGKYCIFGVHFT